MPAQQHPADGQQRTGFAGPRLQLPRFQLSVDTPSPATVLTQPPILRAPMPAPVAPAAVAPTPMPAVASAPIVQHAVAGSTMYASPTSGAATISWDRLDPASAEPTLLQRITPVHMGVLILVVVVMMIATSGPAAMKTPTSLSAPTVSGGGAMPTLVRAPVGGSDEQGVVSANGGLSSDAATSTRSVRGGGGLDSGPMLRVGSATLPATIRHGGIPSPAASTNLIVSGGGRAPAGDTAALQLNGIPSPTAAERLGPQTLAKRADDGMTLPDDDGQRDSHAQDSHYRTTDLPMEEPVAQPAMTPGESAARAQVLATQAAAIDSSSMPNADQLRPF